MSPAAAQPILLDLDKDTLDQRMDKLDKWLRNVFMAQNMYVHGLGDILESVQTPPLKQKLQEFHKKAVEHEEVARDLFRLIGREPPGEMREAAGNVMAKMRQLLANVEGAGGGAAGAYPDIEQLLLMNMKTTGAFAVAAQLATSLGIQDVEELALKVANEKFNEERFYQEVMLEQAPVAIFEERPI